jgi:hypothetical protein
VLSDQIGFRDISGAGDFQAAVTTFNQLNAILDHGTMVGLGDDDHPQYAKLAGGNTFSGAQVFSSTTVGVLGTLGAYAFSQADRAAGAGARGCYAYLGRNSDDSTPGTLQLSCSAASGGTLVYVWSDDTGQVRVKRGFSSDWPTGANRNTDGVVVGTQTSSLDTKNLKDGLTPIETVLSWVAEGAAAVRRFDYKSGQNGGEVYEGVVVDYAPRYGEDRDENHPSGKSLNVINAVGDLLRVVDHQAMQIAELMARVTALEAA